RVQVTGVLGLAQLLDLVAHGDVDGVVGRGAAVGELQATPVHEPEAVGVRHQVVVHAARVFRQVGGVHAGRLGHGVQFLLGDELVKGFLAAEVGVDALFAGPGFLGYPLNARSGDSVPGEFGGGRGDDALSGGVGAGRGSHAWIVPYRTVRFGKCRDGRRVEPKRLVWLLDWLHPTLTRYIHVSS